MLNQVRYFFRYIWYKLRFMFMMEENYIKDIAEFFYSRRASSFIIDGVEIRVAERLEKNYDNTVSKVDDFFVEGSLAFTLLNNENGTAVTDYDDEVAKALHRVIYQ